MAAAPMTPKPAAALTLAAPVKIGADEVVGVGLKVTVPVAKELEEPVPGMGNGAELLIITGAAGLDMPALGDAGAAGLL